MTAGDRVRTPSTMIASSKVFAIRVLQSTASNDHQVRFFLDGEDLIRLHWNDSLGLDPEEVLVQGCPLIPTAPPSEAVVARCSCGVMGCGDESVLIREADEVVIWSRSEQSIETECLRVPKIVYLGEIRRALEDTTWETPDRTAARLVRNRLEATPLSHPGFAFQWATGRIGEGRLTASLRLDPGPYQVLVQVPWTVEDSPERGAADLVSELRRSPRDWRAVRWSPLAPELESPTTAGKAWLRL